ncbi:CLUMA_CG006198, isoform A [Clunio marinus]|uniref:CLUMA_CG006198, isoform A n=1 Tax=Clunio marinus TaxID=568069 RepID=A0A1J1I1C6_9DIPT|nr:CLUMA_CG006198, isoform A [Clunio marinus]
MKGLFLIFLFCFFEFSIQTFNDSLEKTCVIKYLKERGLLKSNFPEPVEAVPTCDDIARNVSARFEADGLLLDGYGDSINNDCLVEQVKNTSCRDKAMARVVVQICNVSEDYLNETDDEKNAMEDILKNANEFCDADESIRKGRYCITKLIIDERIINGSDVGTNPSNIDATDIDCESIIKPYREKFEFMYIRQLKELSALQIDCVIGVVRKNKIFEITSTLGILDNLKMDKKLKDKIDLRENRKLRSLSTEYKACVDNN